MQELSKQLFTGEKRGFGTDAAILDRLAPIIESVRKGRFYDARVRGV